MVNRAFEIKEKEAPSFKETSIKYSLSKTTILDLFGNRQLLAPGGVNKSLGILKYPYVHSGSSRLLSWPETKIFGFRRDLL